MKVFISWSGTRSREIAVALKQWIPSLLPNCKPWIASDEIMAGDFWFDEIKRTLDEARFGVICLTKENTTSPWLLFEAGFLVDRLSKDKISLYLADLDLADVGSGPLGQFDAVRADRTGTWNLILAIGKETGIPQTKLKGDFDSHWPELARILDTARESRIETAAIVFADIVGTSQLAATMGDLALDTALKNFFMRGEEVGRANRGEVIKRLGDGFLATFRVAEDAFGFATEFQHSLMSRPVRAGTSALIVRIGIHLGRVHLTTESYGQGVAGAAVNLAARLVGVARPGEIVISNDVRLALSSARQASLGPVEVAPVKGFNSVEFTRVTTPELEKA